MNEVITIDILQQKIFTIRNKRVMVDRDLARLYQVETKVLIQSVKRSIERFPSGFCFQMDEEEFKIWRSQFVTSSFCSSFVN